MSWLQPQGRFFGWSPRWRPHHRLEVLVKLLMTPVEDRRPRLVLSPCGTSLLTNRSTSELRAAITRHTNAARREDLGPDAEVLDARLAEVEASLAAATSDEAARLSAELNGILTLYKQAPAVAADYHILVCTDTWLGERTGQLVQGWLQAHLPVTVELRRQSDLQTADLPLFQSALSDMVKWLSETTAGYRQQGYHITFNLTGGFKSVQGFLQTLSNLYADETVYIFESAGALLRIPRLPVRMDVLASVRDHLTAIQRLALGLPVSAEQRQAIPETFLMQLGEQVALSPWGTVVWEESRRALYHERVWPLPTERARFGPAFENSIKNLPADRMFKINDKFEKLAQFLDGDQRFTFRSLDLKKLKANPKPPATHEFDAWADRDAQRVFCYYDDNNILVLDHLDKGLH